MYNNISTKIHHCHYPKTINAEFEAIMHINRYQKYVYKNIIKEIIKCFKFP